MGEISEYFFNTTCVIVLLLWVASYDGSCAFLATLQCVLFFTVFHSRSVVLWRIRLLSLSRTQPLIMLPGRRCAG